MAEPKLQEELLHRLADGDLSAEEEEQVRAALDADPDAQRAFHEMAKLSLLMRTSGEVLRSQADPDALFARIEAGIAADAGAAAANGRAPAELDDQPQPSLLERWFGHRTWLPLAGAVAVAGAVLMTVYRPITPGELGQAPAGGAPSDTATEPADQVSPEQTKGLDQRNERTAAPAAATESSAAGSSEVVQVDFGDHAGTVFDVALSDGSSTAVIWINDEI